MVLIPTPHEDTRHPITSVTIGRILSARPLRKLHREGRLWLSFGRVSWCSHVDRLIEKTTSWLQYLTVDRVTPKITKRISWVVPYVTAIAIRIGDGPCRTLDVWPRALPFAPHALSNPAVLRLRIGIRNPQTTASTINMLRWGYTFIFDRNFSVRKQREMIERHDIRIIDRRPVHVHHIYPLMVSLMGRYMAGPPVQRPTDNRLQQSYPYVQNTFTITTHPYDIAPIT